MQINEKNYITPQGFNKLLNELKRLKNDERPKLVETITWAAGNGDRSENGDYIYGKKRLREIDKRLRFLSKRIETAEVLDPACLNYTDIRFGATVTIVNEEEQQKTYSIVGVDESDVNRGLISWKSPLASALLRKKVGDVAQFSSPRGEQEIEIIKIEYRSLG
jgi:transcription elongation factor GreB